MLYEHTFLDSADDPDEAAELARRQRVCNDAHGVGIAERLERGLLAGTAIIGTSRPEAEVVLTVIDGWTPERLREVATSLRELVGRMTSCSSRRLEAEHAHVPGRPVPLRVVVMRIDL
jgi:hypothetical protein